MVQQEGEIDMPHVTIRYWTVRLTMVAVFFAGGLGTGTRASAAECGGTNPCKCGDTVTRSTTLSSDLGVCMGTGLRVVTGVGLDCAGHTITGSTLSPAKYGVLVDGATGAAVKNCRVTGFRKGIRLFGGHGNTISGNVSFTNHDYGIELAGGSTGNLIALNNVYNNRDEGIHVGEAADDNEIRQNTVTRNKHENIYLLSSDGNQVVGNMVTTNDSAGIFIKHSHDTYVADNTVLYGPIYVRGDSVGNTFVNNALRGNGYFFEAYQDAGGVWTSPHDNQVSGGKVENTKTCLRFGGAYDNTVDGLMLDNECQVTMWPEGGQASSGNVVNTLPLP
jgi:parallel beta-helix repeat protein